MSRDRETLDGTPLWAPGAQPCIWMSAGLVAYRLCDRDFDCERCPFDAAMRGGAFRTTSDRHTSGLEDLGPDAFPDDRRYHPGHLWARQVAAGRVRCGIDAFVAQALALVTAVALPALRRRVRRGRVAMWIQEGTAAFPLRAPVSGIVGRTNRNVAVRPSLLAEDPYDAGWLCEVSCAAKAAPLDGLAGADEQLRRSRSQSRALARHAALLLTPDGGVGPTLPDGGPRVDPRDALGPERYHRLLRRFLE